MKDRQYHLKHIGTECHGEPQPHYMIPEAAVECLSPTMQPRVQCQVPFKLLVLPVQVQIHNEEYDEHHQQLADQYFAGGEDRVVISGPKCPDWGTTIIIHNTNTSNPLFIFQRTYYCSISSIIVESSPQNSILSLLFMSLRYILAASLLLLASCAKKKHYTPAETLFVNQSRDYEKRINDYLFQAGTIQWRINGVMDKHSNNPSLYLADPEYQKLIKEKEGVVGKVNLNSFYEQAGKAGNDMNINIINIGVDQDKIHSLDLVSLKKTPGVIVTKGDELKSVGGPIPPLLSFEKVDNKAALTQLSNQLKPQVV